MVASNMAAFDRSHFVNFEQVKIFSSNFADFEQVKNFNGHFADFEQVKIVNFRFVDFEQQQQVYKFFSYYLFILYKEKK